MKNGQLHLDKARIKESERLDEKYLIRTSDDTLPAEDMVLGYKQLVDIEEAFRSLKQTLEVRTVYTGWRIEFVRALFCAGWRCCWCGWWNGPRVIVGAMSSAEYRRSLGMAG